MKHLFIVNPVAGGSDKTDEVNSKLKTVTFPEGDAGELYVTTAPMDAARKIREEAASGGHLRVYACGGDGTFNECVCGAAGLSNVAVCPFPTGTGNDFCRMFGSEQSLFRDIQAIVDGTEHPIDVIDCNGRMSVNICSVGFDARVGCNVHNYSKIPLAGGPFGYVVSLVVELCKGINSQMHIKTPGFEADARHALVAVCNGRFYGGGFNPSRDARPDDGILDIYIVKEVSFLQLVMLIGKYASGRADEVPKYVTHLRDTSAVITFDSENIINADGEALMAKKVEMKLLPGALNLVVPKGMHFFD